MNSVHDATLLFKQFYTVTDISANGGRKVLVKHAPVAPDYVGPASMPNYGALRDQAIVDAKGGGKAFAGHAEDPFFLDIRVFDLLYGGNLSERGRDSLAGFNVNSIALQLPIKSLTRKNGPVLGVWSTASRPGARVMKADGSQGYQGNFVQFRLQHPIDRRLDGVVVHRLQRVERVLEVGRDDDLVDQRVAQARYLVLVEKTYGIKAPKTPRNDLFSIYLTGLKGLNKPAGKVTPAEMLRLNTAIAPTSNPNRLGVLAGDNAGFPNGRRLTDDVVDISLQAVEGAVTVNSEEAPTAVNIVKPLAAGDLLPRQRGGVRRPGQTQTRRQTETQRQTETRSEVHGVRHTPRAGQAGRDRRCSPGG